MFNITFDSPTRLSPSSDSAIAQRDLCARLYEIQREVRRLCDAVAILMPRHPDRVRRQLLDHSDGCESLIRQIQDEADDRGWDVSREVEDLMRAQERLSDMVRDTINSLDEMGSPHERPRDDLYEPRTQRRLRLRSESPPQPRFWPHPRQI